MRLLPAAAAAMFLALALPVTADTLRMHPNGEREMVSVEMPAKGMTMEQVAARFGAPEEKRQPVGDPPITRWIYDEFTVYFEHQYVIHSVVNR